MLHVSTSTIIDEPIITAHIKITDMNCIVPDACLGTKSDAAVTLHLSLRAEQTGNNSLCMPQYVVASSTLLFFS